MWEAQETRIGQEPVGVESGLGPAGPLQGSGFFVGGLEFYCCEEIPGPWQLL